MIIIIKKWACSLFVLQLCLLFFSFSFMPFDHFGFDFEFEPWVLVWFLDIGICLGFGFWVFMIFHLGFSVCAWLFYYTDMYSITFKLQSHKIRHAELIFCSFYLNGSFVLQWCIYSSILYMVNPCHLTLLTYSPSVEVGYAH